MWGERGGTGMGSAKPPPDCRGTAEQEVTAGLGWPEVALSLLPPGREFCCRGGDAEIPAHPSGKVGRWGCAGCWVLGAIPLQFLHYPHPFHLLLLSLSSRSSSHTPPLCTSPGPHIPTLCGPFRPSSSFKGIQEAPGAPDHQIKLKFAAYMQT